MPRKYQHTMELLPRIKQMLSEGMTQKEVEDALGLTGYRCTQDSILCYALFKNLNKRS